MIIKSPFNFVPLNSQVFFPDWADEISQDIPFSDGVSGTIALSISADSPIYIRNGQLHKDEKSKEEDKNTDKKNENYDYSFSHVSTAKGKRYFIPGTSIKGEVRNILEIMSYGRMCVDERAQFARRDLRNEKVYPLKNKQQQEHCGWLRRKGEGYEIEDCGSVWRISHPEIDRLLGTPVMRSHFSQEEVGTLKEEQKTADYKYSLIKDESVFKNTFEEIEKESTKDTRKFVRFSSSGSIHGTIVFTGQPSSWKEPRSLKKGKCYEFVFPEKRQGIRKIRKEDFEHYAFIYKDSKDWERIKWLLDESENGGRGVPVFFIPKGKDNVEHFGMAYLYKMPYDHSVFESLPEAHRHKDKRDLAECIFGYVDKQDALKGRVQFGHAFASEARPLDRIKLVLGSPKASYYPLYISQEGKGGVTADYNTYDHGTPSGWKRYYVRNDTNSVKAAEHGQVNTYMEPLDKGAKFQGTVTFHNLRPIELGALLSALTFHATPECRHQLGMAKAYGFGKCKYDIKLKITASAEQSKDENYYMARFEDYMSRHVAGPWTQQQPIKELFTMAGNDVANGGAFDFMIMDKDIKRNDFEDAKKAHEYLQRSTALLQHTITPRTLCDTTEFKAELDVIRKQEEEKQAKIDRQRRQKELEDFKEDYEQRITNAGTDKGLLNNLKASLTSKTADDNDEEDIINGLIAKIERTISQIPERGFQDAFITEIKDYKLFETRVKAGLRKTALDRLSEDDIVFGGVKLQEAYDHDDKKSPKNWATTTGSNFKKCVKVVGNDIATRWFTALKR